MALFSFFSKKKYLLDPDEILADSMSGISYRDFSEGKIERPIGRAASFLLLTVMGGTCGYLLWRAATLQIASGEELYAQSQKNRFVVRPVFAPRGIIYDRFHRPLVENISSFDVVFHRNIFLEKKGDLKKLIADLAVLLGTDSTLILGQGFLSNYDVRHIPAEIVVAGDISTDTLVNLVPRLDALPGVQIVESYRRFYPDGVSLSHAVGYVGKASEEDAAMHPERAIVEGVGKDGIEAFYDDELRGKGGKKIVEINSHGKETQFRFTQEPRQGTSLQLTLDGELQRAAYNILKNYINSSHGASVVIMDPRDGALRALVSFPGFDTSQLSGSLSHKEYEAILNNPLKPFFNRAIAGEFPSGSTIKPMLAAAALEEHLIDPNKKIYDEGFIEVKNPYQPGQVSVFKDWKKHGWVNFYDAIAWSANVYFYMIGGGYKDQLGLGIERIKKYANLFGLGARLGIDLPGERPGFIPDPSTKPTTDPQNPIWRIGDTYNTSIGQGGVRTTPLQMAAVTAALANGGKLMRPHLLAEVLGQDGMVVQTIQAQIIREGMVGAASLAEVKKGMRQTVTAGTARILNDLPLTSAAKTGTAQAGGGLPHAWITAYAPFENPEMVIVVMVEHAGEGSTVAAPITREIMSWYMEHRILHPDGGASSEHAS
ncbi:MAG: penicillin-binding protein 2 [bacterium]|nr:penicillin-binding protein 2 [bacterium]MDZ4299499.1 penicillin-binding protein 2 [Candidatus Sungbacteria bacterium]